MIIDQTFKVNRILRRIGPGRIDRSLPKLIGPRMVLHMHVAFVISGFFSGLAGVLLSSANN